MQTFHRTLLKPLWCAVALGLASTAYAQTTFDIPASAANVSIPRFAQQAGIQIVAPGEGLNAIATPAIKGHMAPEQALRSLLAGTGLRVVGNDGHTITLASDAAAAGDGAARPTTSTHVTQPNGTSGTPSVPDQEPTANRRSSAPVDVDQNPSRLDKLVVTGSRIHRTELVSPTPVTVLDRQDIESSGHVELSDILLELPSVSSELSTTSTQLSTQNAGLSVVNLRNLGAQRSLVLIDGRRTVTNSANVSQVSLSTIPTDFIERVEVITGGASAVYGSDAVAGVINIITKNDFEGLRLSGRGATSTRGDADETNIGATLGTRFADDRGHMMLSFTYDEDFGLDATDRKQALRSADFNPATNTLTEPNFSTFVPGGRFETNRFFFNEDGLQTDFVTAEDGFDLRPENTLRIDRERILVAGKGSYQITDNVNFFAHAQYSSIETESTRSATDLSNSNAGSLIPLDNPFIPAPILQNVLSRNRPGVTFTRRMNEVGLRQNLNDRDTVRLWTGFEGQLAQRFDWELSFGYGKYQQSQVRTNDINTLFFAAALNAEADPDRPGAFRCKDATLRAAGCVPVNLFGVDAISPEAANFIRLDALLDVDLEQTTVQGHITGDLFELPAGPLAFAAGFEYRDEKANALSDPISAVGLGRLAAIPNLNGSFDVTEGFAEIIVPLLAEQPFAHYLGLEAAVRVADYSQRNVNQVVSYKVGADWAPTADIRFRGQFSRAQRAPSILELFSPARDSFSNIVDPCSGVTAGTTGTVAENCRNIPGIAAAIAETGQFVQDGTNVFAPNSGNRNLQEEKADTWTAGVVLTPGAIPNLGITVDYYRIEVDGAIAGRGAQTILDQCLGDPQGRSDNAFCTEVLRDSDGQLNRINNVSLNLDTLLSEGVDTSVRYPFALPASWGIAGNFDLRVIYTRVINSEQRFQGLQGAVVTDKFLGEVGTPKNRGRFTFGYENGGLNLRWRTNYIGKVVDSNDQKLFFQERGISDPLFLKIGSEITHDLNVSYRFAGGDSTELELFAGVNNIFDNLSPFLPSGTISGGNDNFSGQYDIVGRSVFAGFRLDL